MASQAYFASSIPGYELQMIMAEVRTMVRMMMTLVRMMMTLMVTVSMPIPLSSLSRNSSEDGNDTDVMIMTMQ